MGKSGKKTKESHRQGRGRRAAQFGGDEDLPSSAYDAPPRRDGDDSDEAASEDEHGRDAGAGDHQDQGQVGSTPSKFHLYQLSVQVTSLASIHHA
jgi:hypothetical protein